VSPRYAAFDLDGTLLDAESNLVSGALDGVRRLAALGLRAFLVSGRSSVSFRRLRLPDGLFEADVLLSDGDVLLGAGLTRSLPDDVPELLRAKGVADFVVEQPDGPHASSRAAALAYAMAYRLPRGLVAVAPVTGPAGAIVAFADPALLSGLPARAEVLNHLGAVVLRPLGSCKANALGEVLSRRFGEAGLRGVIAFGDGPNDACLLGTAGFGVALTDVAARHASIRLTEPLGDYLARLDPACLPYRPVRSHVDCLLG
jgi:hypothetical protein